MFNIKKRYLIVILLSIGISIVTILIYLDKSGPYYLPKITLDSIENKTINLESLKGSPVLITFWASTCIECIREIPDLIKLHEELSPQGLRIIGIIIYYNEISDAMEMATNKELPYTIVKDKEKIATYAFGNVHYTPTTFLSSPGGRIIYHKQGRMDVEKIRSIIKQQLHYE